MLLHFVFVESGLWDYSSLAKFLDVESANVIISVVCSINHSTGSFPVEMGSQENMVAQVRKYGCLSKHRIWEVVSLQCYPETTYSATAS